MIRRWPPRFQHRHAARSRTQAGVLSGEIQDQARYEIPVIASSLPGLQHDNQNAFYSGILFGIAGGAGVSLIPALLDAVDRRKSRNEAAAGERDTAPATEPHSATP